MRKILTASLLLALVVIFAGCSMVQVNYERDMARTVIKVDGQEITKTEYANTYFSILQTYMYFYGYSMDQLTTEEGEKAIQEDAIDAAIVQKILEIKAVEYGCYDFTQEELDEIQSDYDSFIEQYKQSSTAKIEGDEANADLSRDELDKLIEEDYKVTLEGLGYDEEEYIESLKDQKAVSKIQDIITETEDPSESEIQSAYDQKVAEQKNAFIEGTQDYESMVSSGSSTIYYYMVDTRNVRHILIGFSDDIQTQISQLRQNGDDEAADTLRDEELAKIKDEADEVYALAKDGADFEELITEYGDDPGMTSGDPYTVVKGGTTYAQEFTDGAFSLENVGDFTQPISSDFGYHIILYSEEVPEGAVPLDQVRESIKQELLSTKQNELYSNQLEAWRDVMKIKVYKSRLALDLGY